MLAPLLARLDDVADRQHVGGAPLQRHLWIAGADREADLARPVLSRPVPVDPVLLARLPVDIQQQPLAALPVHAEAAVRVVREAPRLAPPGTDGLRRPGRRGEIDRQQVRVALAVLRPRRPRGRGHGEEQPIRREEPQRTRLPLPEGRRFARLRPSVRAAPVQPPAGIAERRHSFARLHRADKHLLALADHQGCSVAPERARAVVRRRAGGDHFFEFHPRRPGSRPRHRDAPYQQPAPVDPVQ